MFLASGTRFLRNLILTFRELEAFARAWAATFFAFFCAAVASEKAGFFQRCAKFRIVFFDRARDPVRNCAGLAVASAAVYANENVERAFEAGDCDWRGCGFCERFCVAVFFERFFVNEDFSFAVFDSNSCCRGFATADCDENGNFFAHLCERFWLFCVDDFDWILSRVRVFWASVNFEFFEHRARKAIFRKHSFHSVHQNEFRLARAHRRN